MRHELVHVRQWRDLGVVQFLRQYLGAYFRGRWNGHGHWDAYRGIPLEVEAEQEALSDLPAEAEAEAEPEPADPHVTDVPPLESGPPAG